MKAKPYDGRSSFGVFSASSPVSATVPVRYDRGKRYLEEQGIPVAVS